MAKKGVNRADNRSAHSTYPIRDEFERPIPEDEYPAIDNDLARDNLQNDIPDADLNDL